MEDYCFICNKSLSDGDISTVERGIKTLIESSVERGDGNINYLKDKKSVTVHRECRKDYTRKSSIVAVKRQRDAEEAGTSLSPPRVRTRSSGSFSFENLCFFFVVKKLLKRVRRRKNFKFVALYVVFRHLRFKVPSLNLLSSVVMILERLSLID